MGLIVFMKFRCLQILFFLGFYLVNSGSAVAQKKTINASQKTKKFIIYNALLYGKTPDLTQYGFKQFFIFYEDDLVTKGINRSTGVEEGAPDLKKIKAAALKSKQDPNIPVCLDIESWTLDDAHVKNSLLKYMDVLNTFKRYNNLSKIGYYGVFPHPSPHKEYWYENEMRAGIIMKRWNETNNNVKEVGLNVNIFFPSFYTRNKDLKIWKKIVQEKVAKIKSIRKDAKIYGFVWPQYYSDDQPFNFIDQEQWKFQLETLYQYCDGIVIWSHYLGPNNKPIDFDYKMPWFQTTLQFINKYKIAK